MKDSEIEWVGEIPQDWVVKKAFQMFCEVKKRNVGMLEDNLLSLSYGKIKRKDVNGTDGLLPESFEGYNVVEKDDIVLRLTDLQNDHKSLRVGLCKERGIITSAYVTLRNKSDNFPLFLALQLHAFDVAKGFYGMGGGVRQSLNWEGLKNHLLVIPSFVEQKNISEYLDEKCTEIDNAIAKTTASIEEYKKLKQAIITKAVTKGIRGNRPMKDSGIEWIGEMPADWEVNKAFQLFREVKNKNIGLQENNLLSLSYGNIKRKDINTTEGLLPESFEGYNIIDVDNIVLRLTDLQNDHKSLRVGLCKERGIITSAYVTLDNFSNNLAGFLYYQLHAFDVAKGFYSMGGGVRQSLNWDGLKNHLLAIPPIDEQREILRYLHEKTRIIDELVSKKELFIIELEKYKKSLIYEYVTGKKEVV